MVHTCDRTHLLHACTEGPQNTHARACLMHANVNECAVNMCYIGIQHIEGTQHTHAESTHT